MSDETVASEPTDPDTETPPKNELVEKGLAALETLTQRVTSPTGPATIDASVTQGNRVIPYNKTVPNDPLKIYADRIADHFHKLQPVIADFEATLNELKTLANQIGIGV